MDSFRNDRIFENAFLKSSEVPFAPESSCFCEENLCGRYGKTWNCPPAIGNCNELFDETKKYENVFVFSYKGTVYDLYDVEEMNVHRNSAMEILCDIVQKLKSDKIDYLALGCGSCNICKECTYPNLPCRFPEKVFPPIEAFGIDVRALCDKTGMKYITEKNSIVFFCMIYFNN